jgi:CRISPR-associated protein Csb1
MAEPAVPLLNLERLHTAVAGNAAAVRVLTRLEPVGGPGDKVFPPTYKAPVGDKSLYALEDRIIGGRRVATVLLDSVQSQANRLEAALLGALDPKECFLPVLSVTVPRADESVTRITVLDAPHRATDAIFRDSELEGAAFRASPIGTQLAGARIDNALALFRYCPTALIFGFWDSQSESGIHGAKVPRALTSEIIGLDVVAGRRTSSRLDPLAIAKDAAKVYRSEDDMWTLDEGQAVKEKGKPKLYGKAGKAGKPSAINHGNVLPSVSADGEPGGVTISEAVQTTVLSLPQLRRLRFPEPEAGEQPSGRDAAARTVLAALALYAIALQREEGYFLRSRCHLVPMEPSRSEILGATARDVEPFILTVAAARKTFEAAIQQALDVGLSWESRLIELQPSAKLVELVRLSDEKVKVEGGDDDAGA